MVLIIGDRYDEERAGPRLGDQVSAMGMRQSSGNETNGTEGMMVAYMSPMWHYELGFVYINAKIPPHDPSNRDR